MLSVTMFGLKTKKEGVMLRRFWELPILFIAVILLVFGLNTQAFAGGEAQNYHFTWRLSQVMPVGGPTDLNAKAFAKDVKEATNGRVDIKVYSGGVLGDWIDIYSYVMQGNVDMALQPIAPTYDPRLNIAYYVPYMFTDTKEAKDGYKIGGWIYKLVSPMLKAENIKLISFYPSGWAGMTATKIPPGWQDMKPNGMKIRVMPLKACQLTWKALGYVPTTIPYSEAYSAISKGIVQGESGGPPHQGYQFRDVQKVWIQYNDFMEPYALFINIKDWNKLSKHDQEAIINAARKMDQKRWVELQQSAQEFLKKMKDYGMTIIIPSEKQLQKFAKKVRAVVWPEMDKMVGKTVMDDVRKHAGHLNLLGK